jgi:uncharacterized membrane protein (UPF0182 family)
VGFVVDKMALGQVFSEYFGFPCHLHSTNCSTITLIYHLGLYNRPEVAAVPGDVSSTPQKKKQVTYLINSSPQDTKLALLLKIHSQVQSML